MSAPFASVIINNYNYERFVGEAIESALAQTWPHTEVVIVDDGSTDGSRSVIERYDKRATIVLQENRGQGAAFNSGLRAARGEVILFLDADDVLLPSALERAIPVLDPDAVKVHWKLKVIDEHGRETGKVRPGGRLAEGDLRRSVCESGPTHHLSAPTSGNLFSRRFLEAISPVPEEIFRRGADTWLFETAPFFGPIRRIEESLSRYRVHGANSHQRMTVDFKVAREIRFWETYAPFLAAQCSRAGGSADIERWRARSWWHLLAAAIEDIAHLPQPERPIIVADGGAWEHGPIAGRERLPLVERDGVWYGPPDDDAHAISEVQKLRGRGARFLVIGWPAFWWLEHYRGLVSWLSANSSRIVANDGVVIFDLEG